MRASTRSIPRRTVEQSHVAHCERCSRPVCLVSAIQSVTMLAEPFTGSDCWLFSRMVATLLDTVLSSASAPLKQGASLLGHCKPQPWRWTLESTGPHADAPHPTNHPDPAQASS